MDTYLIYEIIGYVASVLIAVSLMMTNIVRLRVINLIGAATFSLYGVLIGSVPVAAMNGFIVLINIYYLFQMARSKEYFKIQPVSPHSKYLDRFLRFYKDDIQKYMPDSDPVPEEGDICLFILRDMVPAGLIIGKKDEQNRLIIKLDFVIPNYRDLKIGYYLYVENKQVFADEGITEVRGQASNTKHAKYLQKMGFTGPDDGSDTDWFTLNVN